MWAAAEKAIAEGAQEYRIGAKLLKRADLGAIQKILAECDLIIATLSGQRNRRRGQMIDD